MIPLWFRRHRALGAAAILAGALGFAAGRQVGHWATHRALLAPDTSVLMTAGRLHFLFGDSSQALRVAGMLADPQHHCHDAAPFCGDRLRAVGSAMQAVLYGELGETDAAKNAEHRLSRLMSHASPKGGGHEAQVLIARLRKWRQDTRNEQVK